MSMAHRRNQILLSSFLSYVFIIYIAFYVCLIVPAFPIMDKLQFFYYFLFYYLFIY
jgi:hypothetical protein